MYGFDGDHLNYSFPELNTLKLSKVDEIDEDHLDQFLSKNPQLKKIEVTRCAIKPNVLHLLAKYVPSIEAVAFNFRRALLKQNYMKLNLKYLLELQHFNHTEFGLWRSSDGKHAYADGCKENTITTRWPFLLSVAK